MGVYERVDADGQVVETVYAPDGSFEDTRLGVAVLEGSNGWAVVGEPTSEPPVEVSGDVLPAKSRKR